MTTEKTPREICERIANDIEALGFDHAFSHRYYSDGRTSTPIIDELDLAKYGTLPSRWQLDVQEVLTERSKAKHREKLRVAVEEVATTEPIKNFLRLLWAKEERGFVAPRVTDLTDLGKLAARDETREVDHHGKKMRLGKPAYTPKEGCKAKLKLKEAVCFSYRQEAYADHTGYAVPVEIEAGADHAVCRENLRLFCDALRTHNGFAGSGCTWEAELVVNEDGAYVVFDCRASIPD
jgi:hypothetical protein